MTGTRMKLHREEFEPLHEKLKKVQKVVNFPNLCPASEGRSWDPQEPRSRVVQPQLKGPTSNQQLFGRIELDTSFGNAISQT
ncbi:unnamed protein product [Hermetia illucens]|uniref:Uncharacterized protein n=1 Tax=Hermetia illucens TaxID=343691 RepID=A0A7R8V1N4_HERIL|nr:unnamed protein product [Hermetia illucens]